MIEKRVLDAIKKTPFYYKCGYDVLGDQFLKCPIITKLDVVGQINDFHSEIPMTSIPVIVSTSGSSGHPIDIIWNSVDYCNSLMEAWRFRTKLGVLPKDRFVSAHVSFSKGNQIYTNKIIVQKNNLSLSKVFFDEETLLYYYKEILEFEPRWMLLPPSFLYGFMSFLEERKLRFPSSLILVELTGEYCTEELFSFFEETYPNIYWRLMYGMQEFNVIGYGAPQGLQVLKNNVFVEITTEEGKRVENGTEGCIVVTGLKNTAMPLVRYKTGDYGYMDSLGLLHITKSRSNDMIENERGTYDGSLFWMVVLKLKVEKFINVLQFQVVLENNILKFYLKPDGQVEINLEEVKNYIHTLLSTDYGINYNVEVFVVDRIDVLTKSNKIKFFVNNQSEVCNL